MRHALIVGIVFSLATAAAAQAPLKFPQPSSKARVDQTVGLTDISVVYARPAVNHRKVWGGIVPYGEVWRAGANENTTVTFSTPVSVEGKQVAAGTYGLHMIPTESRWTVILSNVNTGWGSFSYDQKDDALRVTVTPEAAPNVERLQFTIDDPTDKSAVLALRWEKLRVPVKIDIDTPAVVMDSLKKQLRGAPQFNAQAWGQAANFALRQANDTDQAMAWADKSLQISPNFQGRMVKAAILEKKGDASGAESARAQALDTANEVELNQYGYQLLLNENKVKEAIAVFQRNVKKHPDSWNVYDSLAEAYQKAGDKRAAQEHYARAKELVKDAQQKTRIEKTLAELQH